MNDWREVTLEQLVGRPTRPEGESERFQFALPETTDEAAWTSTVAELYETHDAYHLGRITQLRAMQGTAPTF